MLCLSVAALPAASAPRKVAGQVPGRQKQVTLKFSKTAHFNTVTSTPKGCLSSADLTGARKLLGKHGSFAGDVVSVFIPHNGTGYFYIDFNRQWKNAISAAVKVTDGARFPDLRTLLHHKVVVTGMFSKYGSNHPQIVLRSPGQLNLLK